jgi:hypothetical protein
LRERREPLRDVLLRGVRLHRLGLDLRRNAELLDAHELHDLRLGPRLLLVVLDLRKLHRYRHAVQRVHDVFDVRDGLRLQLELDAVHRHAPDLRVASLPDGLPGPAGRRLLLDVGDVLLVRRHPDHVRRPLPDAVHGVERVLPVAVTG